ncbi:MAG: hypothetical protein ACHQ6U_08425 [Thermodesulfobacteriota bacterium]
MKLSVRIKKILRMSLIFMGITVVFVVPGVMKCSESVDTPKSETPTLI